MTGLHALAAGLVLAFAIVVASLAGAGSIFAVVVLVAVGKMAGAWRR